MRRLFAATLTLWVGACAEGAVTPPLDEDPEPPTVEDMLSGRWVAVGGDWDLPRCIVDCDQVWQTILTDAILRFGFTTPRRAIDSTYYLQVQGHIDAPDTVPRALELEARWGIRDLRFTEGRWVLELSNFEAQDPHSVRPLIACALGGPCAEVARDTLTLRIRARHLLPGLPDGNLPGTWIYVRR